jgi:ATP-dependent DNA helicase RecG
METQLVEHKKSFGKEVIISLVAFANTEAGPQARWVPARM